MGRRQILCLKTPGFPHIFPHIIQFSTIWPESTFKYSHYLSYISIWFPFLRRQPGDKALAFPQAQGRPSHTTWPTPGVSLVCSDPATVQCLSHVVTRVTVATKKSWVSRFIGIGWDRRKETSWIMLNPVGWWCTADMLTWNDFCCKMLHVRLRPMSGVVGFTWNSDQSAWCMHNSCTPKKSCRCVVTRTFKIVFPSHRHTVRYRNAGWWFQVLFSSIPTWDDDHPPLMFRGVSTINRIAFKVQKERNAHGSQQYVPWTAVVTWLHASGPIAGAFVVTMFWYPWTQAGVSGKCLEKRCYQGRRASSGGDTH